MLELVDRDALEAVDLEEKSLWSALSSVENSDHVRITYRGGKYEVEVVFTNTSGSYIFARGKNENRLVAMDMCIQEAKRLR